MAGADMGDAPKEPDVSIFSQVLNGKITLQQGFDQAMAWLGQTETSVESTIASDPVIQDALSTVVADGKSAINIADQWANTAISGQLGAYAEEAAALVQKYAPMLAGTVGGPAAAALTAAGLTAVQALGQIGVGVVQHEIATFVVAAGGTAPVQVKASNG
jgi:hypothetical protein